MLTAKTDEATWRKELRDFVANWDPSSYTDLGDNPFSKFAYVQTATSWNDFLEWQEPLDGRYGFRGQREADWYLSSSLDRVLLYSVQTPKVNFAIQGNVKHYEPDLLFEYQQQAHRYLPNNTPAKEDTVSWLALMQHHGTPTRLLDWTKSAYVAAYFAMEEISTRAAAIWALDLGWLRDKGNELLGRAEQPFIPPMLNDRARYMNNILSNADASEQPLMLVAIEPESLDARMSNQKGFFLVKSTNQFSVNQLLMSMMIKPTLSDGPVLRKLEIDGGCRIEFLRKLQSANIHRGSLFPDLDGFSRSLRVKLEIKIDGLCQNIREAENWLNRSSLEPVEPDES